MEGGDPTRLPSDVLPNIVSTLLSSGVPPPISTIPFPSGIPQPVNTNPFPNGIPQPVNTNPFPSGIPQPVNTNPFPSGIPQPVNPNPFPSGIPQPLNTNPFPSGIPQPVNTNQFPNGIPQPVNPNPFPSGIPQPVNTNPFPSGIPQPINPNPFPSGIPHSQPINPNPFPSAFSPSINPNDPFPSDVAPQAINPFPFPSDVPSAINPNPFPSGVLQPNTQIPYPCNVLPSITPVVVPTVIVREVLTEGNYAYWQTCVRRYLKSQGLWGVCKTSCESPVFELDRQAYSVWKTKNDMALHVIQVSCSQEKLAQIRDIKRANVAWKFLKRIANPTLDFDVEISDSEEFLPSVFAPEGNYFFEYEELRRALERGNWNDIDRILQSKQEAVRAQITPTGLTPLHIAVLYGYVHVVEKLVAKLNPEDLEQREILSGYRPLDMAASDGIIEIARCMLSKNKRLAGIIDTDTDFLPVVIASNRGKKEMTRFLYSQTPPEMLSPQGKNGATLLSYCIASQILDVALDLLKKHPPLAITLGMNCLIPVYVFGQMPSLFKSGTHLWFWQRWIYSCIRVNVDQASDQIQVNVADDAQHSPNNTGKAPRQLHGPVSYLLQILGIKDVYAKKLRHAQASQMLQHICTELQTTWPDKVTGYRVHQAVIQAVKQGNVEFVTGMIKSIPELIWHTDINNRNIFFIAILNRQEKIFNLLHGLANVNKMKLTSGGDRFGNNMLHLAAMLAPSNQLDGISGAALQMQREMQWFQEVESIVPPICKDLVNADGKKPSELFTEQHANMVKEGEKWMKDTATSGSFVAALIVTIMFAAAFTIPGGNKENGAPIFIGNDLFTVFILSDSISLFSATTSVLMFLGILTSQYAENKFLTRLPTKLIIGLSTLFFSIATMMTAFCAAIALSLKERSTKVVIIPVILLACVPVILFVLLQFSLLVEIFISTYGPGIFNRKIQRRY